MKWSYESLTTQIIMFLSWPAVASSWPQWENFMHQMGPRCGDSNSCANWMFSKSKGPLLCAWIRLKPKAWSLPSVSVVWKWSWHA